MTLATHFSSDPNTFSSNATEFARSLQTAAEGHALWEPLSIDPHGVVEGDCGYFEAGKFRTLFSVYNPPVNLGLPAIPAPQGLDNDVQELPNHNDIIRSSESLSVQVGAGVDLQLSLPPLSALSISLSAGRVQEEWRSAFLAYGGYKRTVHEDRRITAFENYLLEHCDAILDYYRRNYPVKKFSDIHIIYRTTRCISWLSGITHRGSTSSHGQVEAGFAGIGGGAHISVAHSYQRAWQYGRGPEGWDDQTQPGHSIVVRTVSITRKQVLRAQAEQAFLALKGFFGDSRGGKPNPDASGPGPSHDQSGGTSSARTPDSRTGSGSTSDSPANTPADDDASTLSTDLEDSTSSSASDSELIATQYDLLSEALEAALRDNPNLDIVVGSWDAVLGVSAHTNAPEKPVHRVLIEYSGQYLIGRLVNSFSMDTSFEQGSVIRVALSETNRHVDITVTEYVNSGQHGVLLKGTMDTPEAPSVALKLRKTTNGVREINAWRRARHQHILPLLAVYYDGPQSILVSPWMSHGNLALYLFKFTKADRRKLVRQVADALDYLHSVLKIVHGDVKVENVLVSDSHDALLSDFGLCTEVEKAESDERTSTDIHIRYSAQSSSPELLKDKVYDEQSHRLQKRSKDPATDVYAFGMLVLEAYHGHAPVRAMNDAKADAMIMGGVIPTRPTPDSVAAKLGLDNDLWNICLSCWQYEPWRRPSMADVVAAFGGMPIAEPITSPNLSLRQPHRLVQ